MIALDEYLNAVLAETGINLTPANDGAEQQRTVVTAALDKSLFVAAGPGSGKTTASTLRVLKLTFVDGVKPAEILATTFTRKAAKALRSKIVNYGEALRDRFRDGADEGLRGRLDCIDLNGIRLARISHRR